MGFQELMLLAMLLFSFCTPASFSPVSKNLVSENMRDNRVDESNYVSGVRGGGQAGGDGQSNSSPQGGGGNAVIPVYTAGAAAGQRRNHKGAAATGSTPCWKVGFAVLIATSASLLLHIPM